MTKPVDSWGVGTPDFVKDLRAVQYTLSTNPVTEFTTAIAQNATEKESIGTLRSNKVKINQIIIQADQRLKWALYIYGSKDFDESELINDKYIADVQFNMPYYATQQSTSQWRMSLDAAIDYEDFDETEKIHCVLKNLSATSKDAKADGDIKVDFVVENRA